MRLRDPQGRLRPPARIPAPVAGVCDGEGGFTLIELLIALSLLLFTLVAVLGLSMTSSFMASSARQRAAMVNAGAGYLERARQRPYAEIGIAGGDPAGTLVSEVTTSAPYVMNITPMVTWGRPEDPANRGFKTISLSIASSRIGGGSIMDYRTSSVVTDVGATGSAAAAATPTAGISSPVDRSIVWGSAVPVSVTATAASPAVPLVWLDVIDGVKSWGSVAVNGTSAQNTWHWNTTLAREGAHGLVARVTDSVRTTVDATPITLIVDNLAPSSPPGLGSTFPSGSEVRLWWTASTDGTEVDGSTPMPASHYLVSLYRQPSDPALASDYTDWTPVTPVTALSVVAAPSAVAPLSLSGLAGFSRYCADVRASSPDRSTASGLHSAPVTTVGVTEYASVGTWSATYSVKRYTVTVSVNVPTGPTFPWSGTATTRVYRLTSPAQSIASGALMGSVSSASPIWNAATVTDTQVTSPGGSPVPYYYGAVTTLTPAGYGSASVAVPSCVLGPPADLTTAGTRQMVISRW